MALKSAIDTAYWPESLAMTTENGSVNRDCKDAGTAKSLVLHSALYLAYWAVSLPKQQNIVVSIDTANILNDHCRYNGTAFCHRHCLLAHIACHDDIDW
jgi:hypothetical protein